MIYWKERELPNKAITGDEEIAMLVVTFCDIGNVQTFFHHEVDVPTGIVPKVNTTMEFQPPNTNMYLSPYAFLRNKQVQNALRVSLFKESGKKFEAAEMAWKYIEQKGYLR